ncbi:uncharacterized protein LOC122623055 [Drosophila teissieri]|uniref:uncharacterized protein LOC122623055 n=1 Tax=Drosophila teissieri TaxID=7243 RepID=UPI001CBA0459|nr:uncharacterized protein LOC122623055 [Drosophila teissieri]
MQYLHILGFLVFLAASGSTFDSDNRFYRLQISKEHSRQLTIPAQNQDSVELLAHKVSLIRSKRQSFTPFERRVIRLLRKLGLLKSDAEKVLDALEKDKDLLRRLKKLLDEVDKEHETDDFLEDFFDVIFSKKL